MTLSVIMPVHNGVRFLAPAVESVLGQTMGDFELICVEDGSTDESPRILDEFAACDPRIKVLHTGGRGCSAARNAGMDAARGEYIAFIDQDDLYHPQMLELMVSAAEKFRADIVEAAYTKVPESADLESSFPECRETVHMVPAVKSITNPFSYFIKQHKKRGGGIVCPVWNRIFRRSAVANVRFPEGVQPGEDSYFSYLAFDNARSMAVVDATLYAFRQNGGSTSHADLGRIAGRFVAGRAAVLDYWTNSRSPNRERFLACATRELAWIVKEAVKRGDESVRMEVRNRLSELRRDGLFLLRRLPPSKRLKTWIFLTRGTLA